MCINSRLWKNLVLVKCLFELKAQLYSEFAMIDLRHQEIIGVEFTRTKVGLLLHQSTYIQQILQEFDMEEAHPTCIPLRLTHTRF